MADDVEPAPAAGIAARGAAARPVRHRRRDLVLGGAPLRERRLRSVALRFRAQSRAGKSACRASDPRWTCRRVAQEMFEWDEEDRVLFRVVGAKSGHIAGDPLLPVHGDNEKDFRDVLLFNAQAHDAPMRFGALTLQPPPPGREGDGRRRRDHAQARSARRRNPLLCLVSAVLPADAGVLGRLPDHLRPDRADPPAEHVAARCQLPEAAGGVRATTCPRKCSR